MRTSRSTSFGTGSPRRPSLRRNHPWFVLVDNSKARQYALCASGIRELDKWIRQEVQGDARVGHLKRSSNPTTKARARAKARTLHAYN